MLPLMLTRVRNLTKRNMTWDKVFQLRHYVPGLSDLFWSAFYIIFNQEPVQKHVWETVNRQQNGLNMTWPFTYLLVWFALFFFPLWFYLLGTRELSKSSMMDLRRKVDGRRRPEPRSPCCCKEGWPWGLTLLPFRARTIQ